MNNPFMTRVFGYISAFGAFHDPKGKAGLTALAVESFTLGTKEKDSNRVFADLEKLGATLHYGYEREGIYFYVNVPTTKVGEARKVLDEIVFESVVTEADFEKLKRQAIMNIEENESSDRSIVRERLSQAVYRCTPQYGIKTEIEALTFEELAAFRQELCDSFRFLEILGPDAYELSAPILRPSGFYELEGLESFQFIKKDRPQNVISLAVRVDGLDKLDQIEVGVTNCINYSGLVGLIVEKIREEHSAAYYAYTAPELWSDRGMYFLNAGVAEQNTVKALELGFETFKAVIEGDFEEERVNSALAYYKSSFIMLNDSQEATFIRYFKRLVKGLPIEKFADSVQKIESLDKARMVDVFRKLLLNKEFVCVFSGRADDKILAKCQEICSKGI